MMLSGVDASSGVRKEFSSRLRQRRIRGVLPQAEGAEQLPTKGDGHAHDLSAVRSSNARGMQSLWCCGVLDCLGAKLAAIQDPTHKISGRVLCSVYFEKALTRTRTLTNQPTNQQNQLLVQVIATLETE